MPSKSSFIVPKSRVSWARSASHMKIWDMSWMNLIYVWLSVLMSLMHTCHNKLNCTFNTPWKASPHSTFKFGIVSRFDVLDDQGSSSFNFHSSFVRWENVRMFLDTTTVIKHHSHKCTIYQNTIDNVLNLILRIGVVPHQLGATAIIEVAWISRLLGETHRIIFRRKGLNRVHHRGTFSVSSNNNKCNYALHLKSCMVLSKYPTSFCL